MKEFSLTFPPTLRDMHEQPECFERRVDFHKRLLQVPAALLSSACVVRVECDSPLKLKFALVPVICAREDARSCSHLSGVGCKWQALSRPFVEAVFDSCLDDEIEELRSRSIALLYSDRVLDRNGLLPNCDGDAKI